MSFLLPLYLAGAALIALPIVLHLLRRDVAPPVPFTAVHLLQRTSVERARTSYSRMVEAGAVTVSKDGGESLPRPASTSAM